jgi:hypothetical protein
MLEHPCRITKGLKGIDPDGTDRERERDEAAWFTAHPAITAEERERMRERVKIHGAHFQPGHSVLKGAKHRINDAKK